MAEEDFDLESLATYLHLTPDQVRKMANRDKLPGRRVGGGWKFSRAEIHHWFETKIGLSDEKELIEVQKVLAGHQAKEAAEFESGSENISSLLAVERIALPLVAKTKNSVLEKICEFASESGALWQPEDMATALRNREDLHPTALGNGVALLHPRRPRPSFFGEPFLALGITSSGIPFGGPRGCLTDIFFLIASHDEAFHLRVLARLSRLVQQESLLDQLRESESTAGVWQLIDEADGQL